MKSLHRYISKLLFIGLVTNSCFLYGAWPENVASISDKQKNLYERFCKVFKIIENRQPDSYFITLTKNIRYLSGLKTDDELNLLETFISSIEETKSVMVIPDNIVNLLKSQRPFINSQLLRSIVHWSSIWGAIELFNRFFFESNGEAFAQTLYEIFYSIFIKSYEQRYKYDGIVAMYSQYDPAIRASIFTLYFCVAALFIVFTLLENAIDQEDEE